MPAACCWKCAPPAPTSPPKSTPAIAAIDRKLAFRRAAETLFQGLSLGSVLLLAALGLAITFGVMGVINMAHGEMVMLGAYTTFVVQEALRAGPWAGWSLPLSVPAAFLVTAADRRGTGTRPHPPPLRPAAGNPAASPSASA